MCPSPKSNTSKDRGTSNASRRWTGHRGEVERLLTKALLEMDGELQGARGTQPESAVTEAALARSSAPVNLGQIKESHRIEAGRAAGQP